MSVSSNRPASVSPPSRPQAAAHWQQQQRPSSPPLTSARLQRPTSSNTTHGDSDISLRQILERYKDDPELLKHILMAKAEEDKKQTAVDTLKVEQARIQLRELDIELLREQNRIASGYHDKHTQPAPPPPSAAAAAFHAPAATATGGAGSSGAHVAAAPSTDAAASTPYYGLAPVQQQVLARITGEAAPAGAGASSHHPQPSGGLQPAASSHSQRYAENGHASSSHLPPPRSPVAYPHSAHPLCPPSEPHPYRSTSSWTYPQRLYPRSTHHHQPTTPVSPGLAEPQEPPRKRGRSSISNDSENGSITHDQVMEALKAKIQRGSSDRSKRVRIPSPRSSKPILPPIDTSVGRIPPVAPPSLATTSPTAATSDHEQPSSARPPPPSDAATEPTKS